MNKLLTPEDLKELTGSPLKSKQCEALEQNSVPYFKRPDGRPVVTWEAVSNLFGGKPKPKASSVGMAAATLNTDGFNLEAASG